MNSSFANIFLALQQQIDTAVKDITYIDQDLGQLASKTRPPVSWPCVLIDFEDFTFKDLGTNVQTTEGTILLKLGFAPYSNSTQITPANDLPKALGFYDLEYALHKALQGWSPGDDFGSLSRTSASTQVRTDNYRVRELRYKIAFEDYSTKPVQQYAPASAVVTEEIQ